MPKREPKMTSLSEKYKDTQFLITVEGYYGDASGWADWCPLGYDNLMKSIEELKENYEGLDDSDISIFILSPLKVTTRRVVEITEENNG